MSDISEIEARLWEGEIENYEALRQLLIGMNVYEKMVRDRVLEVRHHSTSDTEISSFGGSYNYTISKVMVRIIWRAECIARMRIAWAEDAARILAEGRR